MTKNENPLETAMQVCATVEINLHYKLMKLTQPIDSRIVTIKIVSRFMKKKIMKGTKATKMKNDAFGGDGQ